MYMYTIFHMCHASCAAAVQLARLVYFSMYPELFCVEGLNGAAVLSRLRQYKLYIAHLKVDRSSGYSDDAAPVAGVLIDREIFSTLKGFTMMWLQLNGFNAGRIA